ncbi:outer membrane protein assembly factor BamB family protein [Aureliella helgolandensis]|uniref:Outer membrane biogenesis protein BamB n=1 Tax=Aureliella helgolandensis TaxID=2527968 RepID=A0A518G3X5_9BACT|nr:PQQ-binding-like beta-propeller repeat protein [Aureliella helgolandensis]QDV23292.1 outer membrane biogenesis protein BamB [Aureliella helgolandensis]
MMILRRRILRLAVYAMTIGCASGLAAEDWSRFRGPNGDGTARDSQPVPSQWSPQENLKWKAELPGAGVSSPIVVGDRVFVTCYSGYGVDRNQVGNIEDLKRHLVCVDSQSGRILWDKSVAAVMPEDPYAGIGVTAHGYASHTPVSDGERVYAFFGKSGVHAFDMDGNEMWQASVGTGSDPWQWGSASSPIVHDGLVFVTAAAESQALVALDAKTGQEVWRESAEGFDGMWGTPTLIQVSQSRTELVMSVPFEIWSFAPKTGKLLWYCEASESEQAHSSAVASDGVVYAFTGRGGGSIAVRAGGSQDVAKSHRLWTGSESDRFGTPVVYQGKIYLVAGGIVTVIDGTTGKKLSQTRLENDRSSAATAPSTSGREGGRQSGRGGGRSSDYASPVIADGKLYFVNGSGQTFVWQLGDELEQLSVNRVTDESESFGGTPAVSQGRIFLRSDKHLYCVAAE